MQEHSHGDSDLRTSARYKKLAWWVGVFTVTWANVWLFIGVPHNSAAFIQFLAAEGGCFLLGYIRGKFGR